MKEKNYLYIIIILLLVIIVAFLGYRLVEVEKNIQTVDHNVPQQVAEDQSTQENNLQQENQATQENTIINENQTDSGIETKSKFINEISTIKGSDKDYTVLKIKESFSNSRGDKFYEYYFIMDDSKQDSIGVFINDTMADIQVEDYTGDKLQINEDNIIEYKVTYNDENELILRKLKYTIENGEIKEELVQEYTRDEFTQIGKSV